VENAKVALQHGSISLAAEGREDFVKEVLAMWNGLLSTAPTPKHPSSTANASSSNGTGPGDSLALSQFENIYDTVDGKLKIIADMPGSSKAEKTRNVGLVLLYGHHLQGADQIPSELIREACTDHGCFDSANFASHLKALKDRIVMNTKAGGGYDVKLTAPGRKAAKEFVESLNNETA
jgi:hypothetical protein